VVFPPDEAFRERLKEVLSVKLFVLETVVFPPDEEFKDLLIEILKEILTVALVVEFCELTVVAFRTKPVVNVL